MKHARLIAALAVALAGAPLALARAAAIDDDTHARSGTLGCGGNHMQAVGDNPRQVTWWVFRNYSDDIPVHVDRYRIYDALGGLIFDSDASGMPPSANSNPANLVGPNQSVQLSSQQLTSVIPGLYTATGNDSSLRPLTLKVDWHADRKVLLLEGRWVRQSYNNAGSPYARFGYDCRQIRVGKGRH